MTHIYAVYNRHTSEQKIYTDLKVKERKKIFQANRPEKKVGVAIIISAK